MSHLQKCSLSPEEMDDDTGAQYLLSQEYRHSTGSPEHREGTTFLTVGAGEAFSEEVTTAPGVAERVGIFRQRSFPGKSVVRGTNEHSAYTVHV